MESFKPLKLWILHLIATQLLEVTLRVPVVLLPFATQLNVVVEVESVTNPALLQLTVWVPKLITVLSLNPLTPEVLQVIAVQLEDVDKLPLRVVPVQV